jgi:hypothetical protein
MTQYLLSLISCFSSSNGESEQPATAVQLTNVAANTVLRRRTA